MYVIVAALLLGFAWTIQAGGVAAERALEQRFVDRGELAARFVTSYVRSLAGRERRQALVHLRQASPSREAFDRIVGDEEFSAAVLLDRSGRVLQVWPPAPAVIGRNLAARYAHLREAVRRGRTGISNVVPSAARGVPIVAIAVAYETPRGRRVFSGAFELQRTPLTAYLTNYTPVKGSAAHLVDASGALITRSATTAQTRSFLRRAAKFQPGGHYLDGTFVVVTRIKGTPWHAILTVPRGSLLQPVQGWRNQVGWVLLLAFAIAGGTVLVLLRGLARKNVLLMAASRTDTLTGLHNRRGFDEQLRNEFERSRRTQSPVSLLVLDIDSFKQVNDTFGHAAGDTALEEVAHTIKLSLRAIDVPARFGGDEFAIILPDTGSEGAMIVADRIRAAVEAAFTDHPPHVTTTIGVATIPGHAKTAADAMRMADRALYAAKAQGKNRTKLYTQPDDYAHMPLLV